jgi:hypothetical protein
VNSHKLQTPQVSPRTHQNFCNQRLVEYVPEQPRGIDARRVLFALVAWDLALRRSSQPFETLSSKQSMPVEPREAVNDRHQ